MSTIFACQCYQRAYIRNHHLQLSLPLDHRSADHSWAGHRYTCRTPFGSLISKNRHTWTACSWYLRWLHTFDNTDGTIFVNLAVFQGLVVIQLSPAEEQRHLIDGNPRPGVDFVLHESNRIEGIHVELDRIYIRFAWGLLWPDVLTRSRIVKSPVSTVCKWYF
jgi:hypothetical protein